MSTCFLLRSYIPAAQPFLTIASPPSAPQVEHGADRADDLLPRGHGAHAGAAGPAGQVREQDPDGARPCSLLGGLLKTWLCADACSDVVTSTAGGKVFIARCCANPCSHTSSLCVHQISPARSASRSASTPRCPRASRPWSSTRPRRLAGWACSAWATSSSRSPTCATASRQTWASRTSARVRLQLGCCSAVRQLEMQLLAGGGAAVVPGPQRAPMHGLIRPSPAHLPAGMTHEEDQLIPNLYRYIQVGALTAPPCTLVAPALRA